MSGRTATDSRSAVLVVLSRGRSCLYRPTAAERWEFRCGIIGEYLGTHIDRSQFSSEDNGKPVFTGEGSRSVAFSCASTRGAIAIALGGLEPLGLDIERRDPGLVNTDLIATVLSDREIACFEEPGVAEIPFFEAWTRKEAVLKAAGIGLRCDPREIDVCGGRDDGGWIQTHTPDRRKWWVRSLPEWQECSLALAASNPLDVEVCVLSK